MNNIRIILLCVIILLGLDSVGSSETVKRLLYIDSYFFLIAALILSVFVRIKNYTIIPKKAELTVSIVAGILFSTTVVLSVTTSILDLLGQTNLIFNITRLQPLQLLLLSLFLILLIGINKSNSWWQKHYKSVVFFAPFFFFFCVLLIRLLPFDAFFHIAKEDTVFENIQMFILLLGFVINTCFAISFKKERNTRLFLLFSFFAFSLLFVSGEEVSWGQRIFNVEPTEKIMEINRQAEYTLHNLEFIHDSILMLYVVICVFSLTAHWLSKTNRILKRFTPYTPSPLLTGYFLCAFSIYFGQMIGKTSLPWAEAAEMFFYSGIVLWFLQLAILFYTKKTPKVLSFIKESL